MADVRKSSAGKLPPAKFRCRIACAGTSSAQQHAFRAEQFVTLVGFHLRSCRELPTERVEMPSVTTDDGCPSQPVPFQAQELFPWQTIGMIATATVEAAMVRAMAVKAIVAAGTVTGRSAPAMRRDRGSVTRMPNDAGAWTKCAAATVAGGMAAIVAPTVAAMALRATKSAAATTAGGPTTAVMAQALVAMVTGAETMAGAVPAIHSVRAMAAITAELAA